MAVRVHWVVISCLVVLGNVLAWRAYSQAITYDEAYTWLAFVRHPLQDVFTSYTGNNHVLFSLLAWVTTHSLGVSELTLRLPSLVAAAGYLAIARSLAQAVSGPSALCAVVTAALVLNPFILDFLVAARGYGIGTTALLFAVLHVLRSSEVSAGVTNRTIVVGLALGVSIASNLSLAFPSAGLAATYVGLATWGGVPDTYNGSRTARRLATAAVGIAAPLLIVPLRYVTLDSVAYGADTFGEASRSLVAASLQYDTADRWHATDVTVDTIALVVVPLVLAAWAIAAIAILVAGRRDAAPRALSDGVRPIVIIGGMSAITICCLAIAHVAWNVLLPLERTGLYWLPLFVLGMAASARAVSGATLVGRMTRAMLGVSLAALAVAFLVQFTTSHFRTWRFDAGSREIFSRVEAWRCPTDRARRLTTTPSLYEPAFEFYRVIRKAAHVRPLDVLGETYTPGDADFYVVKSADEVTALLDVAVPVFVHPISGAALLVGHRFATCEANARQ